MPNGRTGGFVVATSEIARVLDDLESNGIAVAGHGDAERDVGADELRRLLRSWPKDHVIVEEQSHSWYILHLEEWITVDEGTPLFARLVEIHQHAGNAEASGPIRERDTAVRREIDSSSVDIVLGSLLLIGAGAVAVLSKRYQWSDAATIGTVVVVMIVLLVLLNRRSIRDWFRRADRPPSPLITTVSFEGRYAPGSAGNAFASEMVEELRSAVESSGAAGFIVDLRGLDYRGGDAIASMGTALYDEERVAFRPAAFVATGPTADSIRELFGPNWVLGVAGVKLFESYDEAHEFVMEKIGEEATETSAVPASNGSASPPTSQLPPDVDHQSNPAAEGRVERK